MRPRDHSNERPQLGPPVPNVVRLIPPPTAAELPIPDPGFDHIQDEETEALFDFGPLAAYRLAAFAYGPAFAVSYSSWLAARRAQEAYLRHARRSYRGPES